MTDYVLPRTESGEVDWCGIVSVFRRGHFKDEKWFEFYRSDVEFIAALKAIDAAARAEERERCALKVEEVGPTEGSIALITKGFSDAIRNLGDSHE